MIEQKKPNTVPASKLLLAAIDAASAMYQRQINDILAAAVEEGHAPVNSKFDMQNRCWILPE